MGAMRRFAVNVVLLGGFVPAGEALAAAGSRGDVFSPGLSAVDPEGTIYVADYSAGAIEGCVGAFGQRQDVRGLSHRKD